MTWTKRGLIYDGCHCQLPIAVRHNGHIRIYVSDRDPDNHSRIAYFDVDYRNPSRVIARHRILCGVGSGFDSHGVMTSCIVDDLMYYVGWGRIGPNVYSQGIGVLNLKTFERRCIIEPSDANNFVCNSPFVIKGIPFVSPWKMWYVSGAGRKWTQFGPLYSIKYATSADGIIWHDSEFTMKHGENEVFSRPFVFGNTMLFSYMELNALKRYHIGSAVKNGNSWTRTRDPITISESGWDSEMVAFPFILDNYLFYSGNQFGKAGVGYATRDAIHC